jgi:hypothetical protein
MVPGSRYLRNWRPRRPPHGQLGRIAPSHRSRKAPRPPLAAAGGGCREAHAAPWDGGGEVLTQEGHELVGVEMALGGRVGASIGSGVLGA